MGKNEHEFKVIILGPQEKSGKTCLLKYYTLNKFNPAYKKKPFGVDFLQKQLSLNDDTVKLQFWDVSGKETYGNMLRVYCKESAAVVVVFDYTQQAANFNLSQFVDNYVVKYHGKHAPIVLVASKSDLLNEEQRQRAKKELETTQQEFTAKGYTIRVAFTNAKDGTNVNKVFNDLASNLLTQAESNQAEQHTASKAKKPAKKKKITFTGSFANLFNHVKNHFGRYAIGIGLALGVAAILAIPGIGQAVGLTGAIGYLIVSTGIQLSLFAAGAALCAFLTTTLIGFAVDEINKRRWRKNQDDHNFKKTQEFSASTGDPRTGAGTGVPLDRVFKNPANIDFTEGASTASSDTPLTGSTVTTQNPFSNTLNSQDPHL